MVTMVKDLYPVVTRLHVIRLGLNQRRLLFLSVFIFPTWTVSTPTQNNCTLASFYQKLGTLRFCRFRLFRRKRAVDSVETVQVADSGECQYSLTALANRSTAEWDAAASAYRAAIKRVTSTGRSLCRRSPDGATMP